MRAPPRPSLASFTRRSGSSSRRSELEPLGTFESAAANEPGHRVVAAAFRTTAEPGAVVARAEIAELRWITPGDVAAMALAPLSLDHLLAIAWP